ncbi:MAG: hypothetical protein ACYDCN_07710 [Bacteroidia bacterium]
MTVLKFWMPADDAGKLAWLLNFKNKLRTLYATILGISTAYLDQLDDDYTNFEASMQHGDAIGAYKKNVTKFKDHVKTGKANNAVLAPLGAAPALPAFSTRTNSLVGDVFGRAALKVKEIKSNPAYAANTNIGSDLKIVGADPHHTPHGGSNLPNQKTAVLKPNLKGSLNKGGRPWLRWKKGLAHLLRILVDRNDGHGFVLLTVASHHAYTDKFALPAHDVTVLWKYKAIYLDKFEEEEGEWSDEVKITITGV